jgi:uncharacterized protein (DUF697 family)
MKKRKLPSAIRRTGDDQASAGTRPPPQDEAPVLPARPGKGTAAAAAADRAFEPIEAERRSAQAASAPTLLAPAHDTSGADERRSQALAIVHRHAGYSALGGIIPLPFANLAGVTALIVHMVKRLSDVYNVPFERERARALAIGLVGGVMPSGAAIITMTTLSAFVPVSGLIGLGVGAAAALACTRQIGHALIAHFESGKTLHDLPLIEWR